MVAIDEDRVKAELIKMWTARGGDTLVKVMSLALPLSSSYDVGYCTTLKYLIGATPEEMERRVGLRVGTKLAGGASIYMVDPLPKANQFHFRGYSNTPAGISTSVKAYHPDYPPGLGVPQWELHDYKQILLRPLADVRPGETFTYRLSSLTP